MKFSKLSQLFLVSTIGLLVATLLTACSLVTVDYVYVASSKGSGTSSDGQIDIFATDSQSGALRRAGVPVSSGGVTPVSLATTSDYANLYVANQGSSTVVHFAVGASGGLTAKDTVTLASEGTTPVAIATNQARTFLYVVSMNHPSGASQTQGGALSVFPLGKDGAIGAAVGNGSLSYYPLNLTGTYASDILLPTALSVLVNNNIVYVTAYDLSSYNPGGGTTSNANPGWVFGYAVGSGGGLTPIAGSPWKAGVKPSGVAADPTNRFVYVTDFASNQLIGYTIQSGGVLNFLINGPFPTGSEPTSVVVDPRGKYIYATNALDSSVSAYTIDLATGTPAKSVNATGSSTNSTDTQPVAIVIEPSEGRYLYTANYLGDSVSGFRLDPTTGTLTITQSTPYPSSAQPSALAAVPHGNHAVQSVTP